MFDDATNLIHQPKRDILVEGQERVDRMDAEDREKQRAAQRRARGDKENRRRLQRKEPESDVSEDEEGEHQNQDNATGSSVKRGPMDDGAASQGGEGNDGRGDAAGEQRDDAEPAREQAALEAQDVPGAREGPHEVDNSQDYGPSAARPLAAARGDGVASNAVPDVSPAPAPALATTPAGANAGTVQQASPSAEGGDAGTMAATNDDEPESTDAIIARENAEDVGGFVGSLFEVDVQAGTVALSSKGRNFRQWLNHAEPDHREDYNTIARWPASRALGEQRRIEKRKADEERERDAKRRRMQQAMAAASQERETGEPSASATLTPITYYNSTTAESRPGSEDDEIQLYDYVGEYAQYANVEYAHDEYEAVGENEAVSENEECADGASSAGSE